MYTNQAASLIMMLLIATWIAGIFFTSSLPSWASYLVGSFLMYVMCSLVLNKMKMEIKELVR